MLGDAESLKVGPLQAWSRKCIEQIGRDARSRSDNPGLERGIQTTRLGQSIGRWSSGPAAGKGR